MRRTILIDTDTASDDAVALIMALASEAVSIAAITTVAGNVPVVQGTQNALFTVELCGATTPVYQGSNAPLLRPLQTADWFHGQDGLGDHGYSPVSRQVEAAHAVDAIINAIKANPGIEIVTLGPLTNLALALLRAPEIADNVSRCVIMGGAPCCEGNVTPAAEYNFWVDPEAARIVFRSQLPLELVGWQLSRDSAVVNAVEMDALLALKTPAAEFSVRSNSTAVVAYEEQTGQAGIALPDPIAMAILLEPGLVRKASDHYVDIQIDDGLTRGMSIVDKLDVAGDERNRSIWAELLQTGRKQKVIWEIDVAGWKRLLFQSLA